MMTIEILNQYRSLSKEIKYIQDELERQDICSEQVEIILRKRKNRCEKLRSSVELFIDEIDDSYTRLAFFLRFIKKMSWQQVANGIGGGNTSDSARMIVKRYMKHYIKQHRKPRR